jgi:hypothetical protein
VEKCAIIQLKFSKEKSEVLLEGYYADLVIVNAGLPGA